VRDCPQCPLLHPTGLACLAFVLPVRTTMHQMRLGRIGFLVLLSSCTSVACAGSVTGDEQTTPQDASRSDQLEDIDVAETDVQASDEGGGTDSPDDAVHVHTCNPSGQARTVPRRI